MTQREHLVRERAYYIWEGEGRIFGRAEAHWRQAETELHASQAPAPLLVQASTPDLTLSPKPAQVLGETLKGKPSRTRSVTATAETKVKTAVSKAQTEPAAKPVKAAKTASKAAGAKAAPATKAATKAAALPRAVEAVATVH